MNFFKSSIIFTAQVCVNFLHNQTIPNSYIIKWKSHAKIALCKTGLTITILFLRKTYVVGIQ